MKKPPLGIVPRYINEERRRKEICDAVLRYAFEQMPIPQEWLEECKELNTKLDGIQYEPRSA
jgi:hypothetical protein